VRTEIKFRGQTFDLFFEQRQILRVCREPCMAGQGSDDEHPVEDILGCGISFQWISTQLACLGSMTRRVAASMASLA
jgi:hypothetical protein